MAKYRHWEKYYLDRFRGWGGDLFILFEYGTLLCVDPNIKDYQGQKGDWHKTTSCKTGFVCQQRMRAHIQGLSQKLSAAVRCRYCL